ncbi:MAG: hypothetical protein ACP5T4_02685 [Candidatus Micrarchaeia archaeon]
MGIKKKTVLGHFKPRFFIISAVIFVVLAYLIYGYAIPSSILFGSFNNTQNNSTNVTYTTIGNGAYSLSIEVTVLNGLHEPMSGISVNAQANIGHAVSCTTTDGTCFVKYIPPKTPNPEKAILFINVGSLHKNINLTIQPDYPSQLLIYGNTTTNNGIYTNSKVKLTIKAIDALGNPAPNDTLINISYSSGYLSATSCLIENGICNVTYYAPQNPGIVYFEVKSGPVQTYFNFTILSRLIKTTLASFGSGGFCIYPYEPPYAYEEVHLYNGENVTWSLNQSLPITSAFVLKGYANFYNFTMEVQNATQQYINFLKSCYTGLMFNFSNTYCDNYRAIYLNGGAYTPYITLQNYIQSLNPILVYTPTPVNNSYAGNLNFVSPSSGEYYFVIFPLYAPAFSASYELIPSNGNPFDNDICYANSYIYNTTVVSLGS